MTPLERAARDRLAQYSGVGFELPPIDLPPDMDSLTIAEVRQLMVEVEKVIREIIAPDLRLVLAALDRHETIAGSVLDTARQVAAHAGRFGAVPERVEITYQADGPTAEQEPHRLTVTLATVHEPATWCTNADPQFLRQREIPHRALTHTAACDALKYRQRCPFDDFEGTGGADDRPAEPGEYLGWFWASKSWTDSGWEYDAGIEWQRDEPAPASELCMCYRGGCYVGLTGPCTCAMRGVQGCPCLAPDAAQPPKAGE